MELILHIGMGKTGTSAIQNSLKNSKDSLAGGNARYMGMWFDNKFSQGAGRPRHNDFFFQEEPVWRERAKIVGQALATETRKTGCQKFVVSNESFFHHSSGFAAFADKFSEYGTIRSIAYARNPKSWLPSAYKQWGLRHKTKKGETPEFSQLARNHIKQYGHLLEWANNVGGELDVRSYDEAPDVVADFATAAQINLDVSAERFYEQDTDTTLLLRSMFNDGFEEPVYPALYDTVIGKFHRGGVRNLDQLSSKRFDFSNLGDIILENRELLKNFHAAFDLDFTSANDVPNKIVDSSKIRENILEYLVEINLSQSRLINRMEARISALEDNKQSKR